MRQRNNRIVTASAFTLVELILVMVVLATILGFVAPSLSRSFQQRHLDQEAVRFLALTEYGRDEAVSQGVPMVVWIDPEKGSFGLDAATGYTASVISRREYLLNHDLHFDVLNTAAEKDGRVPAIQFAPDGSPDPSDVDSIRITDRFHSSVSVALSGNGWGYEIVKEGTNASIVR